MWWKSMAYNYYFPSQVEIGMEIGTWYEARACPSVYLARMA